MSGHHPDMEGHAGETGELDLGAYVLTLRDYQAPEPRDVNIRAAGATIGRSPDCGVIVASDLVSRRHAAIRLEEGKWWVEDLGSRNGTWVNDDRITSPVALARGDRIRVGDVTLQVYGGDLLDPAGVERATEPAARNVAFTVSGHQEGRIDMVARDKYDHSRHHYEDRRSETNYYGDNYMMMMFHASGPAKVLMIVGVLVSFVGVGCWGYPIVRALTEAFSQPAGSFAPPPDFQAIPWLPLGAGLVFAGSLVAFIGIVIARRDGR